MNMKKWLFSLAAAVMVLLGTTISTQAYYEQEIEVGSVQADFVRKGTLTSGLIFNKKIKELAGNQTGSVNQDTVDTTIQSIVFGRLDEYKSTVEGCSWVDVSLQENKSIKAYVKKVSNWNSTTTSIYVLSSDPIVFHADSKSMFANLSKVTDITFKNMTFELVENASDFFLKCEALTALNGIGDWNTSKLENMMKMFNTCSSLTSLDLSRWNTSNVTSMSNLFQNCKQLTSLNLTGWNTSKAGNFNSLFNNCTNLQTLQGISDWSTSNVTSMNNVFLNCQRLTSLNLSQWDTSKVKSMDSLFYGCSALTSLNVSGWNTSNVTSMKNLFRGLTSLSSANLIGYSRFNTAKVTDMSYLFCGSTKFTELDITGWSNDSVSVLKHMFDGCRSLKTIYADEANWKRNYNIQTDNGVSVFADCTSLVGETVPDMWGRKNTFKWNSESTNHWYAQVHKHVNDYYGYFTQKSAAVAYGDFALVSVHTDEAKGLDIDLKEFGNEPFVRVDKSEPVEIGLKALEGMKAEDAAVYCNDQKVDEDLLRYDRKTETLSIDISGFEENELRIRIESHEAVDEKTEDVKEEMTDEISETMDDSEKDLTQNELETEEQIPDSDSVFDEPLKNEVHQESASPLEESEESESAFSLCEEAEEETI